MVANFITLSLSNHPDTDRLKSSPFTPFPFFFQNALTYIASSFLAFVISISPHGTRAIPKTAQPLSHSFSSSSVLPDPSVPRLGSGQEHFTPFRSPRLSERYFVNCVGLERGEGRSRFRRQERERSGSRGQACSIYPICPMPFPPLPNLLRHPPFSKLERIGTRHALMVCQMNGFEHIDLYFMS